MSHVSKEEFEQALRQCESEPIHQMGQIQPHGALLTFSSDSRRTVIQASSNLGEFIDLPSEGAYDKPLAELIGDREDKQIELLIQNINDQNSVTGEISVTLRQEKLNLQARVFASDKTFVLELTRKDSPHQEEQLTSHLLALQRSLLNLNTETDIYRYFDRVAHITRELTGFDRVMVYRFDTIWDGEVIAESRMDTVHSYLGTRFPAGDIPPQARRLYTSNLVRQIADVNCIPVPVLPALNPVTRQPLDMTHSTLRSLSQVHVEYLRNMGVQASMSISLLQNGRLWGLIACHHMTAKQVSNSLQEAAAYLSQAITGKLALIEDNEQRSLGMQANRIIGELLKNITTSPEGAIHNFLLPNLLVLLDATGVIMLVEGKYYTHGTVPTSSEISNLLAWLGSQSTSEVFCCDHLTQHFSPAGAYADIAAGLLATPLSAEMRNCILWLRKEKLRTVQWAGNPEKILHKDPVGVRLSPRKSFETWTESWHGRCTPWSRIETETASSLALALTQSLAQKYKLEQEQEARRRSEEKHRQADQFLAIFENSPIAVGIVNIATSRIVFANQRYADLIESQTDQVIGSNQIQSYENRHDYDNVLGQLIVGRQMTNQLVKLQVGREYTKIKWVLASYLKLEFQGEPSILSWFYDITDRQDNEEALRISNSQLRNILDTAIDGYWSLDCQGRLIDVNPAYVRQSGYTREELLGMKISDLDAVENAAETAEHIQKIFQTGRAQFETRHRRKDGSIWNVEVSSTYSNFAGKHFSAFFRDITERKEAQRLSEQRLQAHIENSPMAVVSWDKDFNVTQWAGEAENMFGWTAAETVGKAVMDLNLIYEEDLPLVQAAMAKFMEAKQKYVISPNRNITKDGRVIHCIWYNTILSGRDGALESVLSLVLDVTQHKEIEQEWLDLNNQLKHEIDVRTSDLSALTAHIQKIAETERANLARELHDEMGSIMAGLHMEVGRLQRKASDPDLVSDLTVIRELISKAVQSNRNIINQLYPTVLDDYGFVHALNMMVKEYGKHSGIDIEIVIPQEDIVMSPDYALAAYRITQECLTNIAKHAGASKVQIEVVAKDGFLDLTIKDNGKGMPSQISVNRHGIFGMKERARYLGGSMHIGSNYGKGTAAHLRIPLAAAKQRNRKRVLVVDDHAIFRDAIRQLIEREASDFSVEGEAADGMAAIQMAIEEEWSLMLLDINLPKMSGIIVLDEIRKIKPKLPVIMLSSHSKDKYGEIALSKGAAYYIEKGETNQLIEVMREATRPYSSTS